MQVDSDNSFGEVQVSSPFDLANAPTPPPVDGLPARLQFDVGSEPDDFWTSSEISGLPESSRTILRQTLDSIIINSTDYHDNNVVRRILVGNLRRDLPDLLQDILRSLNDQISRHLRNPETISNLSSFCFQYLMPNQN